MPEVLTETDSETKYVELDKVIDILSRLQDEVGSRCASIRSWDNYGEQTFLAFDSYNLGLTTAKDMIGVATCEIMESSQQQIKKEEDYAGT